MAKSITLASLLAAGCAAQSFTSGTIVGSAASAASSAQGTIILTTPVIINTADRVSTITGEASVTTTGAVTGATPFPEAPAFADAAASVDQVSSLVSLLQQDRLSSVLPILSGIGTVLAPNNDALEEFLGTDAGQRFQDDDDFAVALLKYHALIGVFDASAFPRGGLITSRWFETTLFNESARPNVGGYVAGGEVTLLSGGLEQSKVVEPNLQFNNGYIHVIDKVLTIPEGISQVLINNNFQALVGALQLSTLNAEDLNRPNGITLFAPTNEAFQNIGNLLGSLSAEDVTNILMYHIAPVPAYASDLSDGMQVNTLAGSTVEITIRDGDDGTEVFVNGARVTMPNMPFINGVVHGIDQVLNPNNEVDPSDSSDGQVQFSGASSVANIPLTSGIPTGTSSPMPSETGATETYDGAGAFVTQAPWLGMAVGMAAFAAYV